MTLKDNWDTGDTYNADDMNALTTQVNENTAAVNAMATPSEVGSALVSAADEQTAREAIAASGQLYVNVKDYGAVGDGVADDTVAIEAAFAVNGGIYFPPGTYNYNGTGMSGTVPTIAGAGRGESFIVLGDNSYLLNVSVLMIRLDVRDISFFRGKGAIKHTYATANVAYKHTVERCEFREYTECAIASDSADMPYWHIKECSFNANNATTTMGIALRGGTDQVVIDSCSFLTNRVHVKAVSGNNMQITNCDFIQIGTIATSGPRVSVWIVPSATTNSGQGFVLRNSKFGNENLVAGDLKVLYADEGSGASNGVKFPTLDADSTGYIIGHLITGCIFMTKGATNDYPVVYSTTPNVRGISISDCYDEGSAYILKFRTPQTIPSPLNSMNSIGPISGPGIYASGQVTRLCNTVGAVTVNDPGNYFQSSDIVRGGGVSPSYAALLSADADDFFTVDASVVGAIDGLGGSNAATFTYTDVSGYTYRTISAMSPGVPVFIEFDLKNPDDGNQLSQVLVSLRDNNSHYHWARILEVPSVDQGWVTYRFHFTPRTAGTTCRWYFTNSGGLTGKTVMVGRPRIYHGSGWQIGGVRPAIAAEATDAAETMALANDLRTKLIDLGIIEA